MHSLAAFAGIAAVVTVTPGPATAMVVRSALRGGRRHAFMTTLGGAVGVLFWGTVSAAGISALVAASEVAFVTLKIVGAIVLVWLGIQSFRRSRAGGSVLPAETTMTLPSGARGFRDGLVTALANVKLAIFFVALFPQFVPSGDPVLPAALAMSGLIVALDLVWYSLLALAVTRVRRAVAASRWQSRLERVTGSVLIGLGLRVALESR
jgi:threonine/homoserine/homoserine lactone efflux protein